MQNSLKLVSQQSLIPYSVAALAMLPAIGLYVLSSSGLLLYVAFLCSLGLGLFFRRSHDKSRFESEHAIDLPFAIAHDKEIYQEYLAIARALKRISQIPDPVFREAALQQIAANKLELLAVAEGTLTFEGTESWRIVYEALLRSNLVHLYRSVAWVKSTHYWQDEPGKQSTQLNLRLVDEQRINVERIVILHDAVWPLGQPLPCEPILGWINDHHRHGLWIKLVRESSLANESNLMSDFGIYGSHAVGEQILDDQCRTTRFILRFNLASVEEAEKRWQRLSIYTQPYQDLLESRR